MEMMDAQTMFAALAQGTRLEALRMLVQHAPEGVSAGVLAMQLGVPQNTLSSHLKILSHAGLVAQERRGRMIWYRADMNRLNGLVDFLVQDCCGGNHAACAPLSISPIPSANEKVCA